MEVQETHYNGISINARNPQLNMKPKQELDSIPIDYTVLFTVVGMPPAGDSIFGIGRLMLTRFLFALIILYSLYLEYDSPLVPSASGLAG